MLFSAAMSLKAVLRSAPVQAAIRWLMALYIRLVFRTTRWRWLGYDVMERWAAGGQAAIYCFWHNRMAMMVYARRTPRRHHMIISPHADGRMIALGGWARSGGGHRPKYGPAIRWTVPAPTAGRCAGRGPVATMEP